VADLVFSRPRYTGGPVDLVFGGEGGGVGSGDATVTITATFSAMTFQALVSYDNRNPRRVSTSARMPHQVADRALPTVRASWRPSAPQVRQERTTWQQADRVAREVDSGWRLPGRILDHRAVPWLTAVPVGTQAAMVHQVAEMVRAQAVAQWLVADPLHATSRALHQVGQQVHTDRLAAWVLASQLQVLGISRRQVADALALSSLWPWGVARVIPPGREVWPPVDPGVVTPRVPSTHLVFACPPWLGGHVNLVFGRVCAVQPPQPPGQVVVPVRSVYMVINSSTLRRVDNNQVLPTFGTTLSLDVDSWTWSITADMPVEAQPLLARTNPAEPVEVELTINGTPYRALVEQLVRNRSWGNWRISVRCRGLAAVLDEPYAPEQTWLGTSARTAQQIANDVLTINNQPIGWTVDWGITDWLVPAGAWSHQGTMISAINAVAKAAGAYVQPHPTARTLRILPRYPSVPWEWGAVTPDFELPSAVVSVEGVEWVDRAPYNRVFVSGTEWGINGQVTRTGTAGDQVAPMVSDPLITHVDAARQRGIAELGRGGKWANVSLRIPVLSETGLILPGRFVRYVDGSESMLGIVRSIQVSDDTTDIWQTLGVESYVS
jgi:hypothetical protein